MSKMIRSAFAVLMLAVPLAFVPATKADAAGIAISGSFQQHHYKMVPGETTESPELYIIVFNRENTGINVRLTPQAPSEVKISLAESDFTIPAGEAHRVTVGVTVGLKAVPGEYMLSITADIQTKGTGIMIVGAVQQQAKLTILGEAGIAKIKVVDFTGKLLRSEIQFCRKEGTQLHPCAFSLTGTLETRVVPGIYLVHAYYNNVEIISQDVTVEASKTLDVTLVAQTVFIRGFSVVPNYYEADGTLAFAGVVYTLENIYEPLADAKVILKVSFKDKIIDEEQIIALPALNTGSTDGSYKYIPAQGWQTGPYTFMVELYSEDKLAARSAEQQFNARKTPTTGTRTNWLLIGSIAGGALILVIFGLNFARRRRQS